MEIRTPIELIQLIRECGLYSPDLLSRAEAAVTGKAEFTTCVEPLFELGVLTRYQFLKIRAGRLEDLLFGPYLILDRIGEGGMGKVYRAVQHRVGRIVAIKMVRPHLLTNRMVISRYKREAKAAAKLDHPNIVSLYDADDINGRYFLAMEYVDGIDLSRMVKQFGNPPHQGLADYHEAAEYIRQAALGLQHAHEHGLVHRDVKPSNLLVFGERPLFGTSGKATVKILDMGLVRSILESEDVSRTELTRDGTVVGTPDYMSPEQAKNSSTVDPRADLYSLGCTLYFLLRGQPPFPEGSPIDKLIRHQLDPPPNLRQSRPDLPEGLVQIVDRLLKKKPDERYSCANDVAVALLPFTPEGAVAGDGDLEKTVSYPMPVFSLEPEPTPVSAERPAADQQSTPAVEPTPTPTHGVASTAPPSRGSSPAPTTARTPAAPVSARTPEVSQPLARASGPSSNAASGPASLRVRPTAAPPGNNEIVEAEVVRLDSPVSSPNPRARTGRHRRPAVREPAVERERKPTVALRDEPSNRRMIYLTAIIFVASLVLLIAALVYRSWRNDVRRGLEETVSTTPSATTTPSFLPPGPLPVYASLPSPRRIIPADAEAALMVFPQPYWNRARTELPSDSRLAVILQQLSEQTRFDPRVMDRVTISWLRSGAQFLALGEGEFLTAEWVQKLESLPETPLPSAGGFARRFRLFTAKNPWAGFATSMALIGNTGYAIADERDAVLKYARQLASLGIRTPAADSELLVPMPSADDPGRPLATFSAIGAWKLPSGKTLQEHGVRRAVMRIRLGSDFDVELSVIASDKAAVESFLDSGLSQEFPKWKPITLPFRPSQRWTSSPTPSGWEIRTNSRLSWSQFHAVVDRLLP